MTNTEHLPDEFTFVTKNDIHYTATRKGTTYEIYEIRGENVDGICRVDYSIGSVEFHIKWGDWIITSPKREQPKAPETYVTKLISVPANKYTIVENNGKSIMAYTLVETDNQPEDRLLSRIKAFTERVSQASVRIYKDHYEVYYDDFAVNAPSDEGLEKLMNAIVVLDEATRG